MAAAFDNCEPNVVMGRRQCIFANGADGRLLRRSRNRPLLHNQQVGSTMTSPFLAVFFEGRTPGEAADALGTETLTKTREGSDTDASRATRSATAAGTKTATAAREQADADDPPRRYAAVSGTETRSRTSEPSDETPRRPQATSIVTLGTQTGTRAREDADADVSSSIAALWGGSIL